VWGAAVQLGAYKDGSMVDFFRMVKKGEQIGKASSARYSPRPEKNIGSLNGADRALGSGHRARDSRHPRRNSVAVVPKQFIDP
jgi:hypothetical protein